MSKSENCFFCEFPFFKEQRKDIFMENDKYYCATNIYPLSKYHSMIITKKHFNDFSHIDQESWNNMLPIIRKVIEKIRKVAKPIGFNIWAGIGDESKKHFHLHIAPKYKKNYGVTWAKEKNKLLPGKHRQKSYQKSVEILGADSQGVIMKNEKAVSQLYPMEEARCQAHTIIKTLKPISNDINAIDQETWNQVGELVIRTVCQIKEKFNYGKELLSMRVRIALGETTGIDQTTYSEFQVQIVTRFSDVWEFVNKKVGREWERAKNKDSGLKAPKPKIKEHQRYAKTLRDEKKASLKEDKAKSQLETSELQKKTTIFLWAMGGGYCLANSNNWNSNL